MLLYLLVSSYNESHYNLSESYLLRNTDLDGRAQSLGFQTVTLQKNVYLINQCVIQNSKEVLLHCVCEID